MAGAFSVAQFQAASTRLLTDSERVKAQWFIDSILSPLAARSSGATFHITSYLRSVPLGDAPIGAHGTGESVDLVPVGMTVRELADDLARKHISKHGGDGKLGQIIDEHDHVHLARMLAGNALPGYLEEQPDGTFALTTPVGGSAGDPLGAAGPIIDQLAARLQVDRQTVLLGAAALVLILLLM